MVSREGHLQLLVAVGERSVPLEPVDGALHALALAVGLPVEADPAPRLLLLAEDDRPDPAAAQGATDPLAGVARIASRSVGPQPQPAA